MDQLRKKISKHLSYLKNKDKQLEAQRIRRRAKIDAIIVFCVDCETRIPKRYRCVRCDECRIVHNRKMERARHLRYEQNHPEAHRARNVIKSVRQRLKNRGIYLFTRSTTLALAEAIASLPKICIECRTTEDLTIQHIERVIDRPDLALEPSNMTTLCRSCNSKHNVIYLRKNR